MKEQSSHGDSPVDVGMSSDRKKERSDGWSK